MAAYPEGSRNSDPAEGHGQAAQSPGVLGEQNQETDGFVILLLAAG